MNAIYFRDGIYVPATDHSSRKTSVFQSGLNEVSSLFGGRVQIATGSTSDGHLRDAYISIDGISLYRVVNGKVMTTIPILRIVSHLNAIQSFGIASFFKNY